MTSNTLHMMGDLTDKPFCETPEETAPQLVQLSPIPPEMIAWPVCQPCMKVWAKWWLDDSDAADSLKKRGIHD